MLFWPVKVDWKRFEASFPNPDPGWCRELDNEFANDDLAANVAWGFAYPLLSPHMSNEVARALGLLTAATCHAEVDEVDFLPYRPEQDYDQEAFLEAGVAAPHLNPQQVAEVVEALDALAPKEFKAEVEQAWAEADPPSDDLVADGFASFNEYWRYLEACRAAVTEAHRDQCGLAFSGL